jgi:integrase
MSVRKRIWVTKTGEEKQAWVVFYRQNGKQHIETFERKKEADARHAEIKVEIKQGTHVAPSTSITVAEAAALWLTACESRSLERGTLDQYRAHARMHITPLIGTRKLTDVTPAAVREFEDTMRLTRSAVMTRKVLTSLSSILSDSQERGLCSRNVVADLRRNRRGNQHGRSKRKLQVGVDIPAPAEMQAIVKNATPPRHRTLFIVAAFTGLRASELRGLRWADVDLKRNELHVRQRADGRNVIGPPKSESGTRTVPFGKHVGNALREHKLQSGGGELVFPNPKGGIIRLGSLIKPLKRAAIAARVVTADGKPKYTGMHALRHFYASWCINREVDGGCGLPPKVVQERLGHANIAITLDIYGHLFPRGDDSGVMDRAEGLLLG